MSDTGAADRARARQEEVREAERRVRDLRDEMVRTADWLQGGEPVRVAAVIDRLAPRTDVLAGREMPQEVEMIRAQLEAMFQRLRGVAAAHPEPVPSTDHGLPDDARFLRDMAGYLTHMLGPEGEDVGED